MREIFTSGQVAKILRVSSRTVNKWLDAGLIEGYRLPGGSEDRRFTRQNIISFIHKHNFPQEILGDEFLIPILTVACSDEFRESVELTFTKEDGYTHIHTSNIIHAGVLGAVHRPVCLFVDLSIGQIDANNLAIIARESPEIGCKIVVGLRQILHNDSQYCNKIDMFISSNQISPADAESIKHKIKCRHDKKIRIKRDSIKS